MTDVADTAVMHYVSPALDLKFTDLELEREYCQAHNEAQAYFDVILAVGIRLVGWAATGLKTWRREGGNAAAVMVATSCASSLIPVAGLLLGPRFYRRYRPWLVAAANASQFWLVALYYDRLYYCDEHCSDGWPRVLAAVVSANGVAFLILTSVMGSLVFRWLFLTQALYLGLLGINNPSICARSRALRKAYSVLDQRLVAPLLASGRLLPATVTSTLRFGAALLMPLPLPASEWTSDSCVRYQLLLQFVVGFVLPCFLAYDRELRARYAFLRRRGVPHIPFLRSRWDVLIYAMPALSLPFLLVPLFAVL